MSDHNLRLYVLDCTSEYLTTEKSMIVKKSEFPVYKFRPKKKVQTIPVLDLLDTDYTGGKAARVIPPCSSSPALTLLSQTADRASWVSSPAAARETLVLKGASSDVSRRRKAHKQPAATFSPNPNSVSQQRSAPAADLLSPPRSSR